MFWKPSLACSFCGKSAAEVAKLVAGPKVYICDACAAMAVQIMRNNDGTMSHTPLPRANVRVARDSGSFRGRAANTWREKARIMAAPEFAEVSATLSCPVGANCQ